MSDITAEYVREALRYEPETGLFFWKVKTSNRVKVGDRTGYLDNHGYYRIRLGGRLYASHRLAWLYVYGCWPSDQIDHIDRDQQNNRIANLRVVTTSGNCHNKSMKTANAHGAAGVEQDSRTGRWKARIKQNKQTAFLGSFSTREEASAAYSAAKASVLAGL